MCIRDRFHREVGTYSTNSLGQIVLSGVDGGETLYLQEVETLPGYQLDETVHEVTLAWGQTSTVELLNELSLIHIFGSRSCVWSDLADPEG